MDTPFPNSQDIAAVDHILIHCGTLSEGESIVIICDETTHDIASLVADRAERITHIVNVYTIKAGSMHGQEPAPEISDAMFSANLIVCLTAMSMAHTQARYRSKNNGARFLSMPDYSLELLRDESIVTDYRAEEPIVRKFQELLSEGKAVHVTGAGGTDIHLNIAGRFGNNCPGFVSLPGALGSPPDIEANIAPLENESEGIVVVDGSIPCREIGLLVSPLKLTVSQGRIRMIEGNTKAAATLERLFSEAGTDDARILAECGIGLNRNATLQGKMLTDEGAYGCVHFGFGANSTIGGKNSIPFHLDFVFREASLSIDNTQILKNGNLVI